MTALRSYAIGDIHGQLDLLIEAHARIAADRALTGDLEAPVVHVGDLVDRGPDSRGVIQHLLAGQIAGQPWIVLKGNHDRMFLRHLDGQRDPGLRAELDYLNPRIGGAATLASYGLAPGTPPLAARRAVPEGHRAFLADLPLFWQRGEVLFVHAGLRPGVAMAEQAETDLLWIRAPFLDHAGQFDWLVVHGHTHLDAPRHYGNRVNIDSGAAYGGPLTAIVIEGREVHVLGESGRRALRPD